VDGKIKKEKEDGMKSKKVEDEIGNVGKTSRIWITESRNFEADGRD
jgi:hypothetical protein